MLAFERLWLRIRLRSFDRDLVWELKSTTAVRLFHVYVREQLYRTIRHNTKKFGWDSVRIIEISPVFGFPGLLFYCLICNLYASCSICNSTLRYIIIFRQPPSYI